MVVHAQILLEARIKEAGGEAPPQAHIKNLQARLGHVIQAKDYLKAQLKVQIKMETAAFNETVALADAINQNLYTRKSCCLFLHSICKREGRVPFSLL